MLSSDALNTMRAVIIYVRCLNDWLLLSHTSLETHADCFQAVKKKKIHIFADDWPRINHHGKRDQKDFSHLPVLPFIREPSFPPPQSETNTAARRPKAAGLYGAAVTMLVADGTDKFTPTNRQVTCDCQNSPTVVNIYSCLRGEMTQYNHSWAFLNG